MTDREEAEIAVVGAGAAGLMAAIWAGRTLRAERGAAGATASGPGRARDATGEGPGAAREATGRGPGLAREETAVGRSSPVDAAARDSTPPRRIVLLDGASKIGAKILVSGGGRCNVTHESVDERAFAGTPRPAIRKVLRRFDVPATIEFFREIGVELKREETGKLFPVTDRARTVLEALLAEARRTGVAIEPGRRVETVERKISGAPGFRLAGPWGALDASRVILATGGKSLPKSGSDGHGYALARALGHSLTRRIFPGLVPLTLPPDHFVCGLSGLSVPAAVSVRSRTGKILVSFTGAVLCTHFGLSGPAILDVSRYWIDAKLDDSETALTIDWLPGTTSETLDLDLRGLGRLTPLSRLRASLPERLARALCGHAGVDAVKPGHRLTREERLALVRAVMRLPLPVTGHRGYNVAEVTAGGVPLSEIRPETMESRLCPGLYLCGEILDVDGRIGGFNFQWAWSSGYTAGIAAVR